MTENEKLEELEKAIVGAESQLALKRGELQKLKSELNQVNMNKSEQLNEVSRLKDKNIALQQSLDNTKREVERQKSGEEMKNLLDGLGGIIR